MVHIFLEIYKWIYFDVKFSIAYTKVSSLLKITQYCTKLI